MLYYRDIKKKTAILQILQLNGHCFLNDSCYFKIIIIILKSRRYFKSTLFFHAAMTANRDAADRHNSF